MRTSFLGLFLLLSVLLTSCSRPSENSRVSLVLPSQMSLGSKLQNSIHAMSEPTGLAEINCVAVVVSGPEEAMSNNTCGYQASNEVIKFGEFHKNVALNPTVATEVTIEVASGSARVFRLIGFKSDSGACPQISDPTITSVLSSPYDLGHSAPYDLNGNEVKVSIPMSFSASKELIGCEGPLMPENSGGGDTPGVPYLRVTGLEAYESGVATTPRALTRGMCYPIHFSTFEPCSGGVCTPRTLQGTLGISLNQSVIRFYESESSCQASGTQASSTQIMAAGSDGTDPGNRINLWARIPLNEMGINSLNLSNYISVPGNSEVEYQQGTFAVGSPRVVATNIPASLAPTVCHSNDSTFTFHEAGTNVHPISSHEPFELRFANLNFFLPGACSTPTSGFVGATSSSLTGRLAKMDLLSRGFDGSVQTVIRDGTKYLVGGDFEQFGGVDAGSLVRLNLDGSYDPTFLSGTGAAVSGVSGVLPDGAGKYYVYGFFEDYQGVAGKSYLVRINSDGSLDGTFTVTTDSYVETLALSGNSLFIGGNFFNVVGSNGTFPRDYLAKVDVVTNEVLAWNPDSNNSVTEMVLYGSYVIVAGNFSSVGGQARNFVAMLDATTGSAEPTWNPSPDNYVNAIAGGSGVIYLGGLFTNIGGSGRNSIAAVNDTNGMATAWNPDSDGEVKALVFTGGSVWAGGAFANIGGLTRNLVAEISTANGLATGNNAVFGSGVVSSLTLSGAVLVAGGDFDTVGGLSRLKVAAISMANALPVTTQLQTDLGTIFGPSNLFDFTINSIPDVTP